MNRSRLFDSRLEGTIGTEGGYLSGTKLDLAVQDPSVVAVCKSAPSLARLQEEYELFSYSALVTVGVLTVDPMVEFANRRNLPKGAIGFVFSKLPIFNGLAPPSQLNHMLAMVQKPYWNDLQQWMDFAGMIDRNHKIYFQMLKQRIPIADTLLLQNKAVLPSPCPTIEIIVYALDGNKACYHFVPAKNPPIDRPYLKKDEPFPETIALANALFSESPNPYDSVKNLTTRGVT